MTARKKATRKQVTRRKAEALEKGPNLKHRIAKAIKGPELVTGDQGWFGLDVNVLGHLVQIQVGVHIPQEVARMEQFMRLNGYRLVSVFQPNTLALGREFWWIVREE